MRSSQENSTVSVVTEVEIQPIKPKDGLVAFASCVLFGQLYVGSIGVFAKLDGSGYRLTYPTRVVGGTQLNVFHPIRRPLAAAIEQAVCAKASELFERVP